MANPLTANTLLAALRAEGCQVVEYRSWRTHNRNHKGAWGPVNGVVIHHTVSSGEENSVALCYNGHATLPGPLCHTVGGKSGKLYMVGHGRANHAGSGDDDVLQAVINETALPADNEANTDGNARFYGIEIVNLGNGKDQYPAVQYDAAVRWAAAICRAHGWNERSVIGHKEWQPGKIDPHGPVEGRGDFSMDRFRADVAERLTHPASWSADSKTPTTPTIKEPLVADKKDVTVLFTTDGILSSPDGAKDAKGNKFWTAESYLRYDYLQNRDTLKIVRALSTQVAGLTATVNRLAQLAGTDVDTKQVVAAVEKAIADAVVKVDVDITSTPNQES